jgi:hypothetical protein
MSKWTWGTFTKWYMYHSIWNHTLGVNRSTKIKTTCIIFLQNWVMTTMLLLKVIKHPQRIEKHESLQKFTRSVCCIKSVHISFYWFQTDEIDMCVVFDFSAPTIIAMVKLLLQNQAIYSTKYKHREGRGITMHHKQIPKSWLSSAL